MEKGINEFYLEIVTPDRLFFEGYVESLIFNSTSGEMGVLYNALPMVTALKPGTIRIRQKNKWMEASNGEGFIQVRPKKVIIMAQMAKWPYEVDAEYEKPKDNTLTIKKKKEQSLKEYKLAKAQLARHFANLRLKDHDID
ncbi:MAG TPA: ATP synthase F1 subunit epsilon [Clostridiales bacterium]|jgi:F-type H+-transporting ATPase subunit epsilon|nr:ATP synthase F1 subunit epsilon [Clostridiales bacterium]